MAKAASMARLWRRGTGLAFKMLEELEETSLDLTAQNSEFRVGKPQYNIVLRYLNMLDGSQEKTAFAAVVTDYIATWKHSGEPILSVWEKRYRHPIATTEESAHG